MFSSLFPFEGYDSTCATQGYPPLGWSVNESIVNPSHVLSPLPPTYDQSCFSVSNARDEMGLSAVLGSVQRSEYPGPKEKAFLVSSPALALLNKYVMSYNCLNGETTKLIDKVRDPNEGGRELSTEEIVRVAAAYFIQSSAPAEGDHTQAFMHSNGLPFSGLTAEEEKNVVLARWLLAAADKVRNRQYEWARNLLKRCYSSSSSTGNPVERVVYYFTEALQERVDRETEWKSSKRARERRKPAEEPMKQFLTNNPVKLVTQQKMPFSQLVQFTSIQTIIDNVGSAKRIHMIDLTIKHGIHWTILMQALATKPTTHIEYLKISAIGTSAEAIDTTRKSLVSFAQTLRLPFNFSAVIVADMKSLKLDMFERDDEEAIGIYSSLNMNTLVAEPDSLENLMRVIRKLKPCIMTVADFEAKHNSTSFITRFTEALFFHSAFLDCLDAWMDRNDSTRMVIEKKFCSEGIRSIVAMEGRERIVRQVGIAMWRSFFARFGLAESELNDWSHYQATLLVEEFANGSSCTIVKNGKSLMIGWKGTPLFFISAWKLKESGYTNVIR